MIFGRTWPRVMLYGIGLAMVVWLSQQIAGSVAADAVFVERDALEQRAVDVAREQATRTRAIRDAYADSLATARATYRAARAAAAAEIPELSIPMQRLVSACDQLEVSAGRYVVTVIQADVAQDTLTAKLDAHVATLETAARPSWVRRVAQKIKDAPLPAVLGFLGGVLVAKAMPP